ncbi:MAG: LLM class flavin-dependent oxidoreductase [Candidatus Caldarchaeum sp.]|nr:LLM class flavin-dependent oxidoreductase [Candidatus Caldarchaeum sp.]
MTIEFGFYCAHEQFDPVSLLEYVVEAERHGFDTIWSSDHFHPWSHTNAHSGFALSWLGIAAERTRKAKIGAVTATIMRYHPGLIAQAFATLDYIYPGRIFLCLATGEAMNEMPLGLEWPSYRERLDRVRESFEIIAALWNREFVTYDGKYYRLRNANLYTKPKRKIPVYFAASGAKSGYVAGYYADGVVVTARLFEQVFPTEVLPALENGAKDAGRDASKIKKIVHSVVSYSEDFDKAVESCRFWNATMVPDIFNSNIYDPRELERLGSTITREQVIQKRFIITSEEEALRRIEKWIKMGVNEIEFLSTSPDQMKFIQFMGKKIIPYVKETYGDT